MSHSTPVYTAHDVPDLFNALPMILGFRPADSLVAIATSGPRRRFGFRLRMDLPQACEAETAAEVVVGHLARNGAEGAIVLALTDRQDDARDLLDAVERRLTRRRIVPIVVARSDGHRYWSDEPGFPPEGIAYETSDHHLSIVEAVAAGQQVLPDRQTLVDRYAPVSGARRRWLLQAAAVEAARIDAVLVRHDPVDDVRAGLAEVQPLLDAALAGRPLDDGQALMLSIWVDDIGVRDAVWGQIDRGNAAAFHQVLMPVVRAVVPPFEPAVLCLASFAAWLSGNGTEALIAAERAREACPGYSMADLMLDVVGSGLSPDDWHRFDEDLRRAG